MYRTLSIRQREPENLVLTLHFTIKTLPSNIFHRILKALLVEWRNSTQRRKGILNILYRRVSTHFMPNPWAFRLRLPKKREAAFYLCKLRHKFKNKIMKLWKLLFYYKLLKDKVLKNYFIIPFTFRSKLREVTLCWVELQNFKFNFVE